MSPCFPSIYPNDTPTIPIFSVVVRLVFRQGENIADDADDADDDDADADEASEVRRKLRQLK